jgi:hypothetical protein
MHGVVSTEKNNVFKDMYKINAEIHSINTRQSLNFHIMFHQNNRTGQKSLFCNGLKIYNTSAYQVVKQEKLQEGSYRVDKKSRIIYFIKIR